MDKSRLSLYVFTTKYVASHSTKFSVLNWILLANDNVCYQCSTNPPEIMTPLSNYYKLFLFTNRKCAFCAVFCIIKYVCMYFCGCVCLIGLILRVAK